MAHDTRSGVPSDASLAARCEDFYRRFQPVADELFRLVPELVELGEAVEAVTDEWLPASRYGADDEWWWEELQRLNRLLGWQPIDDLASLVSDAVNLSGELMLDARYLLLAGTIPGSPAHAAFAARDAVARRGVDAIAAKRSQDEEGR